MSEEALFKSFEPEEEDLIQQSDVVLERYLTFVSDGLTFGVSTDYVVEIITNHTITPLPMLPEYVKGIINLRGQIIPIVDIRLRLRKPAITYTSTSCIIVLNIDSAPLGIIVDSVSQVLDIDSEKISQVPANRQQELVTHMISLSQKEVILLLDCEQLIRN
ncbi:chemotaxis protein CheW [Lachnospiraceae bacterium LCP25S3_G4]